MVPLQLRLKNFLSYRDVTLDFQGLHVACICGVNGAGKSSLLEAIAWAVWGQSRVVSDDDVIHLGTMETQVRFTFQLEAQSYRIIRSRYRGQASALEFQIQVGDRFRSLTAKGIRATQQVIQDHVKVDYDTFLNSAYLKQGHGDEFMAKRPSERKQLLADLLKLDQYDRLVEGAKERSRQITAELTILDRTLERMQQELAQEVRLVNQQAELKSSLNQLQAQHAEDAETLTQLQAQQQHYHHQRQQLEFQQQQRQHLEQECERLRLEQHQQQQQLQAIQDTLAEEEAIATGYAQFQAWQREDDQLSAQLERYQALYDQCQSLQAQYTAQVNELILQQQQSELQRESIAQQLQALQPILNKADSIAHTRTQLQQAHARLKHLDQLQLTTHPLYQRQNELKLDLERHRLRLQARLEELQFTLVSLDPTPDSSAHLQDEAVAIAQQIDYLNQRRVYQERVRDKGVERRHFLERLHERQRDLERQLAQLDGAIAHWGEWQAGHEAEVMLHGEWHIGEQVQQSTSTNEHNELFSLVPFLSLSNPLPSSPFSPLPTCPLCSHTLNHHHWQVVLQCYQTEKEEVLKDLWVLREQMTASEREIQILRQEYKDVEQELTDYAAVLQHRGRLDAQMEAQLATVNGTQTQVKSLTQDIETLTQQLAAEQYGADIRAELTELEQQLHALGYDDKDHALVRGQVSQWRWADGKAAELRHAKTRQAQLLKQQREVEEAIARLTETQKTLDQSPLSQQLQALQQERDAIGYDLARHTAVREQLRHGNAWPLRHHELVSARQNEPPLQQSLAALETTLSDRLQSLQSLDETIQTLTQTLVHSEADAATWKQNRQALDARMQERRSQLDELMAQQGKLQQQQQQLTTLKQDYTQQQIQQQQLQHQLRVHQSLTQAFGKNGIQAFMIENLLPQFEAETNRILGQLSAHQLHVQFVTQRATKTKRKMNRSSQRVRTSRSTSSTQSALALSPAVSPHKLIDTLDILIADTQGTRPYETYSGGEAFRVNFAIRLALARLLAQRSGTSLQLLVIDEGFGTQDQAGCDRLISAINAIAPEFSCILTITHMPHLKEVFDTRIEVTKTAEGSQLTVVN